MDLTFIKGNKQMIKTERILILNFSIYRLIYTDRKYRSPKG